MNLDELVSKAENLFVLPDSVTRLKACMDDEASSIDDIGDIIAFDPSLATQLLRVANSALYRFPNKIDTVTRAIQVVGTRSTYDLALAYGVSQAFSDVDGQRIDLDKFWEQSVSCGLLAKYFADMRNIREPERLFVSGLLHNIGELVTVSVLPESATRCQAFNTRVSPAELQFGVLGFTYAELSARLIEKWDIPNSIYTPIASIHKEEEESDSEGSVALSGEFDALDMMTGDDLVKKQYDSGPMQVKKDAELQEKVVEPVDHPESISDSESVEKVVENEKEESAEEANLRSDCFPKENAQVKLLK